MIGIVSTKRTRLEEDQTLNDPKKRKVEVRRRSARINARPAEIGTEKEYEEEELLQSKPINLNSEMSEYEKMRLKNIEENQKFFASLDIFETKQDMLMLTPGGSKKPSTRGLKSEKKRAELIVRRPPSLRLQRIDPSGDHLPNIEIIEPVEEYPRKPAGPLSMTPTNIKNDDIENLNTDFTNCVKCLQSKRAEARSPNINKCIAALKRVKLTEEKVAKVVPQRIYSLAVYPSTSKLLVGVGGKLGHLGIWDVESKDENDGVYLFQPHSRPVTCLKFAPADSGKLFSCSYDGTVRCGDLNKLVFDDVYHTDTDEDQWLSFLDLLSPDGSQLLVGQNMRQGYAALVDRRTNSSPVHTYNLHDRNVKTVSIHPQKRNYFITASNDSTVALWDLRMLKGESKNKALSYLPHTKTVSSAFFSPLTGRQVLTTSADDNLRIAEFATGSSAVGLDLKTKIRHNNHTGRWLRPFQAQWHPRLEDIFVVGSMIRPRRIEIYSTDGQIVHNCMDDDNLASVCSINAFHPSQDVLIGGNSSGRVHIFM